MKSVLLGLLFTVLASAGLAQTTASNVTGNYTPGFYSTTNYVQNPSCSLNTSNITQSTASIVARQLVASGALFQNGNCKITTVSATDYADFAVRNITTEPGLAGQNCMISAQIAGTGSGGNWAVSLIKNSAVVQTQTLPDISSGSMTLPAFTVPCGSVSDLSSYGNTYKVRFSKLTTTASPLQVGQIYFGLANSQLTVSNISDWTPFTMVISGTTTAPATATGATVSAFWRRVGGQMEITYNYFSAAATGASAGSGTYLYTLPNNAQIDASKAIFGTSNLVGAGFTPLGFGQVGQTTSAGGGGTSINVVGYDSTHLMLVTQNQSAGTLNTVGSANWNLTTANASFQFRAFVPISGWTPNVGAARADQTNFGWTLAGVNQITGTTTAPAKGTIVTDKVWYKRNGQNMDVRIEYVSSSAGTSGAGDYLFAIPNGLSIDTTVATPFSTVINSGASSSFPLSNTVGNFYSGNPSGGILGVVGVYDATHVRLFGGQQNSSSTNGYGAVGANFSNFANGAVSISATYSVPIAGWTENQKAPVLVGGVTSAATGSMRIEGAYVTATGGTVTTVGGSNWLTGCSTAAPYSCTITTGIFSAAPICQVTSGASQKGVYLSTLPTTTGLSYDTYNTTNAARNNGDVHILCFGQR